MDELVRLILKKYNIDAKIINASQKGYRNHSFLIETESGEKFNLIIYKKEPGILDKIKSAHLIAEILQENNLPVRIPLTKILKIKEDYYACIYNYLPGNTIPWDSYTKKHLKLLGEYLNQIHFETSEVNTVNFISEAENLSGIINKMLIYFKNSNVKEALENKLQIKTNFLKFLKYHNLRIKEISNLSNKTLLHMDFVRGNILFSDGDDTKITGIIDFEKSSYGSPLFDLARTLAFLIIDCKYKSEADIRRYFLKSGYLKRGKYKLKSFTGLNNLVLIYLIYDFYKFLRHNPYEFLLQNDHFLKTKEVLLKSKLLELV